MNMVTRTVMWTKATVGIRHIRSESDKVFEVTVDEVAPGKYRNILLTRQELCDLNRLTEHAIKDTE